MERTLTLGRLFDIRVGVHASWLAVYAFMTLSLASVLDGVPHGTALGIGAIWALALFTSVVAHEFAHALVARRFGVQTSGITLFLFGGVATLECEPPTPRAEVTIALAGPLASAAIAVVAGGLMVLAYHWNALPAGDALGYLAVANGVLAVFNLLPAYPMDGGRVLRAALWQWRGNRASATATASLAGVIFAGLFIVTGLGLFAHDRAWHDLWYVLLGGFLARQGWVQLGEARAEVRREAQTA
jgi:Zn-dependent protease